MRAANRRLYQQQLYMRLLDHQASIASSKEARYPYRTSDFLAGRRQVGHVCLILIQWSIQDRPNRCPQRSDAIRCSPADVQGARQIGQRSIGAAADEDDDDEDDDEPALALPPELELRAISIDASSAWPQQREI